MITCEGAIQTRRREFAEQAVSRPHTAIPFCGRVEAPLARVLMNWMINRQTGKLARRRVNLHVEQAAVA